ncbi:response regulator [Brachymonas sp. G13]|uniref:response regulator n=1 Tax=Brachymonas wangyanguii TaxID=3130163 RepID=UPI0016B3D126|nr:response regulator [Ramlibacter sp.]
MAKILVVDDEHGIRELLSEILNDEGHAVDLAENAAEARQARQQSNYDLVLLDIWMPDTDGVTLLKEWSGQGLLTMPVIMMSGHATIDTAVEATRIGAQAFLEKPITMQKLLKAVQLGLARDGGRPAETVSAPPPMAAAPAPVMAAADSAVPAVGAPAMVAPAYQPVAAAPTGMAVQNSFQSFDLDKPLRDARDEFERCYFIYHLQRENGSMTRVAEKTGLERTHLYRKLKQLGVDIAREKKQAAG